MSEGQMKPIRDYVEAAEADLSQVRFFEVNDHEDRMEKILYAQVNATLAVASALEDLLMSIEDVVVPTLNGISVTIEERP